MHSSLKRTPLVAFVFALLWSSPAFGWVQAPESAQDEGAVHRGEARVETRLITDVDQVAPGETFRVGIAYRMDPDWHIYWRNPGDAGLPTDVTWTSEQASFGELRWSAPEFFSQQGDVAGFGYSGEIILFAEATAAPDAAGEITIQAKTDYLACANACLPGHSRLRRSIPVASTTAEGPETVRSELERFSARVPRDAEKLGLDTGVSFGETPLTEGASVDMALEVVACRDSTEPCPSFNPVDEGETPRFFADANSRVEATVKQVYPHPNAKRGWVYDMTVTLRPDAASDDDQLTGVLKFRDGDGALVPAYVKATVPVGSAAASTTSRPLKILERAASLRSGGSVGAANAGASGSGMSLWWALLLAFGGGMILNLMPCVFPVLAFKVTSFARVARESRRHKLAHGAAYTLGIVGTLSLLAAAVIGLRVAGTSVGWGFQFQHPEFPAALTLLLVGFAGNLFGAFDIGFQPDSVDEAARDASGLRRSGFEGILAVLLATPCSAPFLGTAVGFALTGSTWHILAIFAALGLGLAAPFVALTLVPGWAKVLPKPGDWMDHLKHALGFALLGTVVWLLWIVGRQAGVDGMTAVLAMAIAIGFAAWLFGRIQYAGAVKKWSVVAGLVLALGAGGTFVFPLDTEARAAESDRQSESVIDWKPWSTEAVDRALKQGRPVFVDFTADWCLTCKVNEKNAIEVERTAQAAERADAVMLKADWTNGGEAIQKALKQRGKGGVPMYLVYTPGRPESPKVLPELLTTELLVDALKAASEET
jgi:thiol:disulfide interchange protein DsbD